MRIAAVVQARMGSTRLPGKSLMPLAGMPVVDWVVERVRRIGGIDQLIVATTDAPGDDPLVEHCSGRGVLVHRGSESDVLQRYLGAASRAGADAVVRVTGDCPFLDPQESERVVRAFLDTAGCEYASNIEPPTLPDGLDTEVVSVPTLMELDRTLSDPTCREHVTLHIRRNLRDYTAVNVRAAVDLSHLRWTLDEPADLEALEALAAELHRRGQAGSLTEILSILDDRPELGAANRHLPRNAALAGRGS